MAAGTLDIPFAIGTSVWWVGNEYREEWITCPECNGDRALTLIKGNGEKISLACNLCQEGYSPSRGVVRHHRFAHAPTPFVCERVEIYGDDVRYAPEFERTFVQVKDLYASQEECQARCEELNWERQAQQERQVLNNLQSKRGTLSHSSHYWSLKAKALEKELVAVRARIQVCKQAAKDGVSPA